MSIKLLDDDVSSGDLMMDGIPVLPSGAEYVDDHILEKPVSELSAWVSAKIWKTLDDYVEAHELGVVFFGGGEQGYRCFDAKPRQVRKPDVSFVRRDLSGEFISDHGYTRDVPELVVEVLSPNDLARDITAKLQDYKAAGTKLIWIIDPMSKIAQVHSQKRKVSTITETMTLSGEDVLPGFELTLQSVLPKSKKRKSKR